MTCVRQFFINVVQTLCKTTIKTNTLLKLKINRVSCCEVFPFQEISDDEFVYENSSVENTYDHYKLMDKCSQFNLNSFNYSDCSPHNFGNDRPKPKFLQ